MAESLIRFGYLTEKGMANAIASHEINAYNVVFTKDTKCIYIMDANVNPIRLKSRVGVYNSESEAITDINNDKSTYAGELISIKDGDKFSAYIVYGSTGDYQIRPVYNDDDLDYNKLSNIPIINKVGTDTQPVQVKSLTDGNYHISGYVIYDSLTENVKGDYVIVETKSGVTTVTRIGADTITAYAITNGTVESATYITDTYLAAKDYVDKSYLSEQFAAFDKVVDQKIEEYVDTHVEYLVQHVVDEKLNQKFSETFVIYGGSAEEVLDYE